MLRVLGQELRVKGVVEMPDLGFLLLQRYDVGKALDINTGRMVERPPTNVVKFKANHKLKDYFHQFK